MGAVDEMGYSMSRLEVESDLCDDRKTICEVSSGQRSSRPSNNLDHEVAQDTKLKSQPHELLSRGLHGRRNLPVSTVKMLAGREGNYSGRGRFSSSDCCHLLSKYLPVNGPWLVDQMDSRAYISQFSADGSLFVAAFQVRIYHQSLKLNLVNVEFNDLYRRSWFDFKSDKVEMRRKIEKRKIKQTVVFRHVKDVS